MARKRIIIAGTRGIPASHGGFETFAEKLALYLKERGWDVTVSCQVDSSVTHSEDEWHGIKRMLIPIKSQGAWGTIQFDWKTTLRALSEDAVVLVLGYNTAVFSLLYKVRGIPNVINMDGIEWKRRKWKPWQKAWLYFNERIAGVIGTRLIADHPEIKRHLSRGIFGRKYIEVIPYGADPITETSRSDAEQIFEKFAIKPFEYALVIARPEPENQILEIVQAFSNRRREAKLLVLGTYKPNENEYHRAVLESAGDGIIFPGAIYDQQVVGALRAYTSLYIHGHSVGGTNPSLVEALAAGSPVLAHGNKFNTWVAGSAAEYFDSADGCREKLDFLLEDQEKLDAMRDSSISRYLEAFRWDDVLARYEEILIEAMNS